MKNNDVIKLAIKRHDLDAKWFQETYNETNNRNKRPFLYGRKLVLDELERVLKELPSGARILDVGSGTGHLTGWLKEKGYEVEGLEPSEKMLAFASKNFPTIQFTKGISSSLPYEDQRFDLIVSFEVMRYLTKEVNEQTYREFSRVLKPNGKIFVTHVNRYALDLYYIFYYIKGFYCRLRNVTYHYCYFTTSRRETSIAIKSGFSKVTTVGRMDSKLRIANKFGSAFFSIYKRFSEIVYGQQRFIRYPLKNLSGHLILIGRK